MISIIIMMTTTYEYLLPTTADTGVIAKLFATVSLFAVL